MNAPSSKSVSLSLTCQWDRTRFELLDSRSAILRMLDEKELLESFSVSVAPGLVLDLSDDRVVELDLNTISLYEVATDQRAVPADEVIADIGALLGVHRVLPRIGFQHLIGWESFVGEPQEAFAAATQAVVGQQHVGATDFALLFDSVSRDGWNSQAEFGVIEADDAPERLLRQAGRAVSYRPPRSAQIDAASFAGLSLADISTFVDSSWSPPTKLVGLPAISNLVTEATQHANEQAAQLHKWVHPQ